VPFDPAVTQVTRLLCCSGPRWGCLPGGLAASAKDGPSTVQSAIQSGRTLFPEIDDVINVLLL
jgi:hypothetical protein